MNRHAYLIMAHNNFYNLEHLLKALDYEENDIYLHIDKKAKEFDELYFSNLTSKAKTHIYSEIKTNWGGYSLVECELFLLNEAYKNEKYFYYHLLSGADLPIKKHADIMLFFEQNAGYEFVQFRDRFFNGRKREISRRVSLYYWIQEYRGISKNEIVKTVLRYIAKGLLGVQVLFHVDRLKNKNIELKYGSQWFSISQEFVQYLLENRKRIQEIFNNTLCPDEFVIQTMLYNSDFKTRIYQGLPEIDERSANLREIDWDRSKDATHPYTWRQKDLLSLKESELLFARKFDENVDKTIIDQIYAWVRE